jgi:hypothetical protein
MLLNLEIMKIIAKDNSALLGAGEHRVTIKEVYSATAKASDLYKDQTEQLAVVFQDENGKIITRWYNLKGYELNAKAPTRTDEQGREVPNYAISKDGSRVENVANTEKALRIVAQLAIHAGFEEGEELDVSELTGKSLGIMVQRDEAFGSNKVAYTMSASKVSESAESALA